VRIKKKNNKINSLEHEAKNFPFEEKSIALIVDACSLYIFIYFPVKAFKNLTSNFYSFDSKGQASPYAIT